MTTTPQQIDALRARWAELNQHLDSFLEERERRLKEREQAEAPRRRRQLVESELFRQLQLVMGTRFGETHPGFITGIVRQKTRGRLQLKPGAGPLSVRPHDYEVAGMGVDLLEVVVAQMARLGDLSLTYQTDKYPFNRLNTTPPGQARNHNTAVDTRIRNYVKVKNAIRIETMWRFEPHRVKMPPRDEFEWKFPTQEMIDEYETAINLEI